jgi:hypothetical protein
MSSIPVVLIGTVSYEIHFANVSLEQLEKEVELFNSKVKKWGIEMGKVQADAISFKATLTTKGGCKDEGMKAVLATCLFDKRVALPTLENILVYMEETEDSFVPGMKDVN